MVPNKLLELGKKSLDPVLLLHKRLALWESRWPGGGVAGGRTRGAMED